MSGYRSLAHNRDFTVLWIGQTISELGSRMSLFVFPLLGYQLTHSAMLASLAEAAYLIGLAGALLPAGVLADRTDRRRLMRGASGSGAVLYGSLAVAGIAGHLTLAQVIVVALLTGIGAGVFAPTELAAIRSVVPTEDLPTALSQNQARQHVASLLGGPVGGALYGLVRWLPFAADSLSFVISWLALGRIRTDLSPAPYDGGRRPALEEVREGLSFTLTQPLFRTIAIWSAAVNLTLNALFFVAILRLVRAGFHPAEIGLVETAAGTAGILGALAAPWIIERFATGSLTVLIAWVFVPAAVPLALWNNPSAVAACLAAVLLLNPAGNAGIMSYRIAQTPDELQGRVASAAQFLSMSVMPLAPVVGGAVMTAWGGEGAVLTLGALTGVAALIVTLSRTVRSVPRPAYWPARPAAVGFPG